MKPPVKKILFYGCFVLLSVVAVFLVIQFLLHFGDISAALGETVAALRAIVLGCVMAYLLYPLARFAEHFLLAHKVKKRAARTLSSMFALLVLLVLLVMFAYFIIPQLVVSLPPLVQSLPSMLDRFYIRLSGFLSGHGVSTDVLDDVFRRIETFFRGWLQDDPLSRVLDLAGRIKDAAQSVLNFVIGIIVMVYVLSGRDDFISQGKKFLFAVCRNRNICNHILTHLRTINSIFSGFVSGKLLDSLIIGILCGICLSILRIPSVPIISVIIGVTNIIPVFGPFFGAVPSALLLLLTDPGKCLIFIIFIVVLQQIDGNVIGPKILGGSTGLPAFWVLFALLLFNHIMRFWGMLLGVPLFASFAYLLRELINFLLRRKGLPVNEKAYLNIESIDESGRIRYQKASVIDFPPLFRGEDSLLARLRRNLKKRSDRARDPADEEEDGPCAGAEEEGSSSGGE